MGGFSNNIVAEIDVWKRTEKRCHTKFSFGLIIIVSYLCWTSLTLTDKLPHFKAMEIIIYICQALGLGLSWEEGWETYTGEGKNW